ncbi:MAG: cellobiose phosphorylase [Candidatus Izemoplasmataceae bacterium]
MDYYYNDQGFVIKNYNKKNPFANFLPGVAGKMGIPLWAFYVNRAQGISGFGLQDKNHPIMVFTPANKAYETVGFDGFRTFIKTDKGFYEPFKVDTPYPHQMIINPTSFTIEEENTDLGLRVKVVYFGLPNEKIAGLVRKVFIENISSQPLKIELLDGIAEILPSGIQNEAFKSVSNVLASWIDVNHLDEGFAFYKLRASTGDSSEVKEVRDGNFYMGFSDNTLIKPIIDKFLVFRQNTSKSIPDYFIEHDLKTITQEPQIAANKIPCGFIPLEKTLNPRDTIELFAMSGHAKDIDLLKDIKRTFTNKDYVTQKELEAKQVIDALLDDVKTDTRYRLFNDYIKQNYLDNMLRGGYPIKIGDSIYHLYSRRHGDLERDYNFFSLAPEYYSQGNGNFRDICQNRRMDVFINKDVERFNIKQFYSLIQLDGYNPLSINGINYKIKDSVNLNQLLDKHFTGDKTNLINVLNATFTPGSIVNLVERNGVKIKTSTEDYLNDIIKHSQAFIQATFGEGFWIDHFTYLIDLVEAYEGIYPDKMESLFFDDDDYQYYDSPVSVKPRSEKIVLNDQGKVRQYHSLRHFDEEKIKRLNMNPHGTNWAKIGDKIYTSNLFTKLFILVLNKQSNLDPLGYGIEMEAEKPGWNDAMNGVPGLLGSGVSETIEVIRIIDLMLKYEKQSTIELPIAVYDFYKDLEKDNRYENRLSSKERYRERIRFGLEAEYETLSTKEIYSYLKNLKAYLLTQIEMLFDHYEGLLPTFLTYKVKDYQPLKGASSQGYGYVTPNTYDLHALPTFLEAPARLLKIPFKKSLLSTMVEKINQSELYDKELKMYKTSVSLDDESHEIGRVHAFTKGWLERESNFLHMTYKYLLGLLKAGLYEAFYEAIKTNLVCFMDPEKYGRSTLENSSFIAPSNNPNPYIHGQGFSARLSGSTIETINMWALMMTGGNPFKLKEGHLICEFEPKIHASFFKDDHTLSFTFLKDVIVTYHNPSLVHTYEAYTVKKIELIGQDIFHTTDLPYIKEPYASKVRDGFIKKINIYMK